MKLANARKVEILSAQIQAEVARVRRVSGAAGNFGVFMREMNIAERGLIPGNAQVSVKLLNRFSVGRGVRRVNVALRLGMRARS